MKTNCLFVCGLVAALGLTSCDINHLYTTTRATSGSFKPYLPPSAGPIYTPLSRPYRNSSYLVEQDVSYARLPSVRGASHYVCYDSVQPQPIPLPQKVKTWRYTSRYPTEWGAPIWVTTYRPARKASPAPVPVAGESYAPPR
ncbi:hypothetical protein [Prosthecobacter sp.]|uniref:hypothetical protein n=1 Tax=Prosthecobacter sp. TaxID=1965333 RepID=UPI003782FD9C